MLHCISSRPKKCLVSLIFISFAACVAALGGSQPVWHDNDDPRDVYTQEFLLALASSGSIELVGTSTSTVITPFNPYVDPATAAAFGPGRVEIQDAAVASGLNVTSEVTPGVETGYFAVPPSGRVEDTAPLNSTVGTAIAAAANQYGTPERPLIVICGGAMTVVADAYLIDPTIAPKIVVYWLGGTRNGFTEYNSAVDGWGNAVVAKYLRLTMFPIDIPSQEGASPVVPKTDLLTCLPASPMRDLMVAKDHPSNPLPGSIDADGLPAVYLMNPAVITGSQRKSFSGTKVIDFGGQAHAVPVLANDPNGNVTVVTAVDQALSSQIWWLAFERAFGGWQADPFRYYPVTETGGAQVAFATHEISATYRGPLVTVFRESDGSVASFYEGNRQGSLDTVRGGGGVGLTRWHPAGDTVRVIIWHDQSGQGRDAIAASPELAPRIVENGRMIRGSRNEPVLRFTVDDSLQVDDGNTLADTIRLSVSVWGLVNPWSVSAQGFISKEETSFTTGLQKGWKISVTSPDQLQIGIGGAASSPQALSSQGSIPRELWHHTSTVFNGSLSGNSNRLKSWLDSKPLSLSFGAGTIPNRIAFADSPLEIGTGGTDLHLDGELGEVIVWTNSLAVAAIGKLHSRRFVSDFSSPGAVVALHDWAAAASLAHEAAIADAVPYGDGISNLLKYAFNLDGSRPDSKILTSGAGNLSGLPNVSLVTLENGRAALRLEYLRRRNAGLTYVPEIGAQLGSWQPLDQVPVITPINEQWERAVMMSAAAENQRHHFIRVKVRLP
ncbi:hypothetical protein HQ447_16735 [bacterium]|nr:hypothetical protein [bacterium]